MKLFSGSLECWELTFSCSICGVRQSIGKSCGKSWRADLEKIFANSVTGAFTQMPFKTAFAKIAGNGMNGSAKNDVCRRSSAGIAEKCGTEASIQNRS